MSKKKVYEKPQMDVIVFETEDIIRTSGDNNWDDNELPPIPTGMNGTDDIFYL